MKHSIIGLLAYALLTASPWHSAGANDASLRIVYEAAEDANAQGYIDRLRQTDAIPMLLAFINETMPFSQALTLRLGAKEGPLFDPAINEIWIPGEFLEEIDQRFKSAKIATTAQERQDVIVDVFTHTLLHEVGHAIIAQFNIPTLGKEEDAVDNLATVFILDFLEDGDTIALHAADMFALEDEDIATFQSEDFWDEHSLDIQRYFTTLCHVYGALPDDNIDLVEAGELSEDKADSCIDEYAQISSDWLFVLEELREPE